MFIAVFRSKKCFPIFLWKGIISFGLVVGFQVLLTQICYPQTNGVQPQYFAQMQQGNQNYLRNSQVFRQEIARFQINVVREGKEPLPITQVPRVQQGDILKVKLLDEQVGGLKLDQTMWDWTFLVTFINPMRRMTDSLDGNSVKDKAKSGTVSEEIQFRKTGWYKEYSFKVPYDSQPVFFLYPRPKYRKQLMKVVSSKYEDLRKLGEKTIELAGAYSQINSFLNELQFVLNRNAQQYGFTYNPGTTNNNNNNNNYYNPYNPYSPYNPNPYNPTNPTNPNQSNVPIFGLATVPMLNHIVEGLARSFNINLPSCWGTNGYSNYLGNNGNGGMNSYGSSPYSSGYGGSTGGYYGGTGGSGGNNQVMDFINRAQCVAKNVNLEEFDISVTRMWQQGGVFLMAELQKKYPQIAYWINIAAAAIDFIVKVFQKAPLRIVPTMIQSSDSQGSYGNTGSGAYGNTGSGGYGNQYSNGSNTYSPNPSSPYSPNAQNPNAGKISLFADTQPTESQFVTAYPIVVHKWQATPDPDVISLYPPVLAEPCLHAGTNLLKSIELSNQSSEDQYSRNFRLVLSSENGFRKEFPLRKNLGLGGWELNLTPEDLNSIPKIKMNLEAELVGSRGFNDIRSPKFQIPLAMGGSWEITPESQKNFVVGGKRTITLRNNLGSCRCLQAVIYKPSFGGQFVFETNNPSNPNNLNYSVDGKEVTFEIDTGSFQPGNGTLEVKTYGGETQPMQSMQTNQYSPQGSQTAQNGNNLTLKLYPAPPIIQDIKARRGDREILLTGERLEQINSININGKRAIVMGRAGERARSDNQSSYPIQTQPTNYSVPNQGQIAQTPTLPSAVTQTPSQYRNLGANQRVAVFEDQTTRITANDISLEISLDDNRTYPYPTRFAVGISRPSIKANEFNEIDGSFVKDAGTRMKDEIVIQNQMVMVNGANRQGSKVEGQKSKVKNQRLLTTDHRPQLDLTNYPIVLNDKNKLTLAVQNVLTDYNFRLENLSIETNIENATTNPMDLPGVTFEVLDTNNLRINFNFSPTAIKALSGRRLQFRIKDRERGDSDWYSIKQTFVRIPTIELVKCTSNSVNSATLNSGNSVNSLPCELRGEGLDYIAQISTDGGRSWFPQSSGATLQVQPTAEGNLLMMIPMLINQKFLQIKLRDFPNTEGLAVNNFAYSNKVKKVVEKTGKNQTNQQNKLPNPNGIQQIGNQPANQIPNQPMMNQPIMNQPNNGNKVIGQPSTKPKSTRQGGQKVKKGN